MTAVAPRTGPTREAQPGAPRPRALITQRLVRWLLVPDHAVAVGVFALAAILGSWNASGAPVFQDDEGTYVAQAVAVQNGGLAPYTYWYDHPPLGWILLAVLGWIPQLLGLGGHSDLAALRYVMAVPFAITATLLFLVARRVSLHVVFAGLAATLYVISPLTLTLARQVYLDSLAVPWVLLAVYLALSPGRALWHHIGAGVAFALALLTKLTIAVFGPALLLVILGRERWRGRSFSVAGFLCVGGLIFALFPMMALLRGELVSGPGHVSLQDALAYHFLSRSGSGWIWEEGSPRQQLLAGWLQLDSHIVVGGLAATVLCLFSSRTRWIALAVIGFAVPVVMSQGYLPAMNIIALLPFLALAIGVGAQMLWQALRSLTTRRMPGARIGGPLLAAALIAVLTVPIPVTQWVARGLPLLVDDHNSEWRQALEWVDQNVPRDDVVMVPYSMWQDLNARGWDDPWKAIVLEKVDLDSQFATEHPNGWREIDWIVEGPSVAANIQYLSLDNAGKAFESSRIVAGFGPWHIRSVNDARTHRQDAP